MQLRPKKKRKIGKFLANASMALLCSTSNLGMAKESPDNAPKPNKGFFSRKVDAVSSWAKWSGEFGTLGYSETEGRVQALEPAIKLNAEFEGDRTWSTKLVFDSLTGASPNGALNSSQPQTFTSPSGKASYTVNPGEQPLFNQFRDTRINLATSWAQPRSRLWKWSIGFSGSTEYDYLSLGVNTSFTKDSEDKNRSWTVGVSFTSDTIKPVGGVPTPLATMVSPSSGPPRLGSSDQKTTYDLLLGLSQIVSRRWIMQGNVSLGYSSGYMNDPYKFVTVFEESAGATLGDPQSYIHENRPDKRLKSSVYLASKYHFEAGILTVGYRFFSDDWGLHSSTLETSFNFGITKKWRLEPSFRYYKQSAVDFYRLALGNNQNVPEEITADYRLGDLTTLTPGLKIIRKLNNDKEFGVIFRFYTQTGDASSFRPVGSQVGQDLIPKTDAYIVQIHYSF